MGQLETVTEFVFAQLRWNVPYITVVWHDWGLAYYTLPNLVVMSMGGFGHVALPELWFPWPDNQRNVTIVKPFRERRFLASFMGSSKTNDYIHGFRRTMCEVMTNESWKKSFEFIGCEKSALWIDIAKDSQVVLCPRGYGRNTLRLGEMMHIGLLPVIVYDDVPFIPYPELYYDIGWTARINELPQLVDTLQSMSENDFAARRDKLLQLRTSHFDKDGVLQQIRLFLKHQGDLKCEKVPAHPMSSEDAWSMALHKKWQFEKASLRVLQFSRLAG
mmetsp:Transcript_29461/g.75987  ORF Transcript_29461/g.75987 Transcript_29461/m.75987 type:complete len:274 (-) Transcript_29461:173-994(-)